MIYSYDYNFKSRIYKKKTLQREANHVYCYEIMEHIESFIEIINNEDIKLNDGIKVQIQGPYKYKNYIYFGEYNETVPHGRGVLLYKNDDKYFGNFKNGKKNGKGVMFFKNGCKYFGHWDNNEMEGYGKYYFTSGAKYEGYFKSNRRDGAGILTTKDGTEYKTVWEEGTLDNYGQIIYDDGKIYEGYIFSFIPSMTRI